jgi:integrase
MHMLQAGVDITVIALWLGHESTQTTHGYVEADLATFRRKIHFPEVTRRKDARAPAKRNPPRDRRGRLEKPDLEIRMEVNLD